MPFKDVLLAEFDHEMGITRRLLERVPDAHLAWKPHDRSMSLGALATHIANLPDWGASILNDVSYDLNGGPPNATPCESCSEILARFDEAARRTRAAIDKTDAEYHARWTLKRGDHEMFSLPRATAFLSFVLNHVIHHRGQLSVYLRLNGVPVPAIYGPSADEGL